MIRSKILVAAIVLLASATLNAEVIYSDYNEGLDLARRETIKKYLNALNSASASRMSEVFTGGGTVTVPSQGSEVYAVPFFNNILPKIQSANLSNANISKSIWLKDSYGASFSYHWVFKDGRKGGGSYDDAFYFKDNSVLLSYVNMHEKFN